MKIELLDVWENVIGEIIKDLSSENQGQISVSYNQGLRRSCNLTLSNIDKKYSPNEDSYFWFNRKFKIYIGLVCGINIYWWSQGIYVTKHITSDDNVVNIEGVDKFAFLDGTLKLNMAETKYVAESGTSIRQLIQETLLLDLGNGLPIDSIEPVIDAQFNKAVLQREISVEEGGYIGEIFTELANSYSAEIYYDIDGHLIMHNQYNDSSTATFYCIPHLWNYDNKIKAHISGLSSDYSYENINCITVYTNSSKEENFSYTAYNTNPRSPLRVSLNGIRRGESQEISITYTDDDTEDRCRQYAEHLLSTHILQSVSKTFNSILIPHLDVGKAIGIGEDRETYIIQSLTLPLGVGEMNVVATNLQWLPD